MFLVVTFLSQQLLVFLLPHLSSTHRHLNVIGVLHLLLALGGDRIAIRIQQLSRNSEALSITSYPQYYVKRIFHLSSLVIFLIGTSKPNPLLAHASTTTYSE